LEKRLGQARPILKVKKAARFTIDGLYVPGHWSNGRAFEILCDKGALRCKKEHPTGQDMTETRRQKAKRLHQSYENVLCQDFG
jgi:hypothetical protein